MYKLLFLCAFIGSAHAATYCADTTEDIQAALGQASINGEDDIINIAMGTYLTPEDSYFKYVATANEEFNISIIGGWTSTEVNPCALLINPMAHNTVLDANSTERVLSIQTGTLGNVNIENIQIKNGLWTANGAGLRVNTPPDYSGEITISNNAFTNNIGPGGAAINILGGNTLRIINNLFYANHGVGENGSFVIYLINNDANGIYFINNTVVNNTMDNPEPNFGQGSGARIYISGTSKTFIANNIFWGNDGRDLFLSLTPGAGSFLYNNDIEDRFGSAVIESNNLSVNPNFVANNDFRLHPDSLLLDAGHMPPTPPFPNFFQNLWELNIQDIIAANRIQNNVVDIGAYEGSYLIPDTIFEDGFEEFE